MHNLGYISITTNMILQVNCQPGSFHCLSHINDFFQTRHSQRNIFGGHSSIVEGIESHLRSGLTNTLRCKYTSHFTRADFSMMKSSFYLAENPIQGGFAQTVLLQNALASKIASDKNTIQCRRIALCFDAQDVITHHYHEASQ